MKRWFITKEIKMEQVKIESTLEKEKKTIESLQAQIRDLIKLRDEKLKDLQASADALVKEKATLEQTREIKDQIIRNCLGAIEFLTTTLIPVRRWLEKKEKEK